VFASTTGPDLREKGKPVFTIPSLQHTRAVGGGRVRLRASLLTGLLAALAAGLVAPVTHAQVLYGSIVGVVSDSSGAAIPGVQVTIVNRETGLTRETTTGDQGNYSLINVLAGPYDLKVSLAGFKEIHRANVPVSVGQIARVDATLEVGALTELVTVESASQLLQTDKADVSTELRSREIEALPTNQFRNYQALLNLVPGTAPARFQNAETDTPARSLAVNVNGQAINNNATRTDGATNVNIWLPSHNMYVSPAETVDSVNVSTNNFDAEQGMAGGAAITVVTKSGTNQVRGSAFEFYNSDKLNASPYFFGTSPTGKPDKLPVRRDIFGGTVGGPIKRNSMFFFGSFEGYKSSQSLFTFHSVPNAALRNGDFSGALNTNGSQQVIYDPLTGNPDGTGRTPFPGNVIPANRINPIARQLLGLYPLENTAGVGAGGLTNNYQRPETRTTDRFNYDGKVNWNRTSSHQIWAKYSYMNGTVDDLTNYLGPDPNAEGDGGLTKVWQLTAGQTWTLSPTLILDSTFGFSRQDQQVLGPDFQAGNYGLDVLGIPGTNDQGIGDERYAGFPRFGTGFSALGNRDGWNPIFRDERTYSFAANMTKVAGRHEFRGGYLGNYLYLDHWQPESGNPRGNFDFATNATALRNGAQAGNFYNQYAAMLLGLVGTANRSNQAEDMTAREWQHAMFVRDRFTITPKLTLDLGLRWEYYPLMKRADRGLERLDLDTLQVIIGGKGGNPDDVGLSAAKDNFAPRVGAVYRFNDSTVLRSGFGVTYNPIPWGRVMRGDNIYPVTIASNFPAVDAFGWVGTINQGIPFINLPSLESGRVALPNSATIVTPEIGNVDRGTIKSWNLALERRLPMNIGLDVAYVAAYGDGGYAFLDINSPQVIGSGNQGRPYFAQFGRINDVNSFGQRLKTRYNSMQVSVNRPMSGSVMIKGAYTWSKSMNMADEDGRTGLTWDMLSQYDRNYALAGYHREHNFQAGFLYQLPWQSTGHYDNVFKALLQDWQINGVFAAFTGSPFTVTANGGTLNTPSNQQTADQVGDVVHVGQVGAGGVYYDRTAWAQPTGVRYGNSGRNAFIGPGGVNVDLSLFRGVALGGTRRLEVRVEAFNLTNTPKFGQPNTDVTSGSFMVITGTLNAYSERQIRLGLRFAF
jgi:hypothetical protein